MTVHDICAAADIAPRTFHRYFASKEDVVAEPVRRMTAIASEALAGGPAGGDGAELMRRALGAVGGFVVEHRELLTGLRVVAQQSSHLRMSYPGVRPDQEAHLAAGIAGRTGRDPADWRLRLLVACSIAGFRVWYEDYFRGDLADPLGHLDRVLRAAVPPGA